MARERRNDSTRVLIDENDPWEALHAHFEKQSRRDGGVVEEVTVTGKGAPAK